MLIVAVNVHVQRHMFHNSTKKTLQTRVTNHGSGIDILLLNHLVSAGELSDYQLSHTLMIIPSIISYIRKEIKLYYICLQNRFTH